MLLTGARVDGRPRAGRRPVRTPLVQQTEEADCGAACLAMVLAWHGRHVPRHELQQVCGAGRDGLPVPALARAAAEYGLQSSGKRVRLTGQRTADLAALAAVPVPAVAFVDGGHFLVLEGVTAHGQVVTNDPASGRRSVGVAQFARSFGGVLLTFAPTDRFAPGGEADRLRADCVGWLSGHVRLVAVAVAAGLAAAALGITAALLLRTTVLAADLEARPVPTWSMLALALVAVGVVAAAWAQQRLLDHVLTTLAVERSRHLIATMLTLPSSFFHRRFTGGVAARAQIADTIAIQLTGTVVPAMVNAVTVVVVLAVMVVLAPVPAGVAALGAGVSAWVVRRAARDSTAVETRLLAEQFRRDGEALGGLSMVETVKAEGSAARLFDSWAESQARTVDLSHRSVSAQQRLLAVAAAVDALVGLAVLVVGAVQIGRGSLAVADLIAVATLLGAFQAGVGGLGRSSLDLGRLRSSLAMYADVVEAVPDKTFADAVAPRPAPHLPSASPARRPAVPGRVELRGVTFGYDTNRPPIVRDVTLCIEPGERVAVVGPSGSGKSTLARLLVGAARPWAGEVLLDGRPLDELSRESRLRTIAYVSQDPVLFEGTVADNVAFGDAEVPDTAMWTALRAAHLDAVVEQRGGLHEAWVHQDGRNFSGGERQRIAIARALCRRPGLLVLDEATSALERPLEAVVDEGIRRQGATTVVVAHRLDTVRPPDVVVVMAGGSIVQLGAARDLSAADGPYRALIAATP